MTTLKPRAGMRLTIEEFLELPDPPDRQKMELDDGALYIMPRPRPVHNFLQFRFARLLDEQFDKFDELPAYFFHDVIVELSEELRRLSAPDLLIVLANRADIIGERVITGAPDIVVEVLSSDRSRDLVRKRELYAEAGVLEYWIVDPRNDTVALLELRGGQYFERAVLTAADTLTTPLLPGLAVPLADVFHHRSRPA